MKGEKMETDIQDLMAWQKDAERELSREAERLEEKGQRIGGLMKVLEATEEILAENSSLREELERKDGEIDALSEELEQKDCETDALREELERKAKEMDELRRQLQEASSQPRSQTAAHRRWRYTTTSRRAAIRRCTTKR